jgi:hypothetical protein
MEKVSETNQPQHYRYTIRITTYWHEIWGKPGEPWPEADPPRPYPLRAFEPVPWWRVRP